MDPLVWLVVFCLAFFLLALGRTLRSEGPARGEHLGVSAIVLGVTLFSVLGLHYREVVDLGAWRWASIALGLAAVGAGVLVLARHDDRKLSR